MTQFRTYQACLSAEGWQPVEVASSDGVTTYVVLVNPWGNPRESLCHCEGYNFRGQCRHQEAAVERVCGWTELKADIQSPHQRQMKQCPHCGNQTKYEIEVQNG